MLKKVGISLMAAFMMSSVALACDFSLANDGGNKKGSKQEERKVLKFDKEVVKKILMEDGYLEGNFFTKIDYDKIETDEFGNRKFIKRPVGEHVDDELDMLNFYDSRLQPILDAYIADRTINNDIKVEGLTMEIVMKNNSHCNFWKALYFMNKAINDHECAKQLMDVNELFL